jgi:hypothetical protein
MKAGAIFISVFRRFGLGLTWIVDLLEGITGSGIITQRHLAGIILIHREQNRRPIEGGVNE